MLIELTLIGVIVSSIGLALFVGSDGEWRGLSMDSDARHHFYFYSRVVTIVAVLSLYSPATAKIKISMSMNSIFNAVFFLFSLVRLALFAYILNIRLKLSGYLSVQYILAIRFEFLY